MFDLLIKEPELAGEYLGERTKTAFICPSPKNKYKTPVVLITGFSEILESVEASALGADGFLAKPFRFEDVRTLIDKLILGKTSPSDKVSLDEQYCRIPLESFVTGSRISFSIFHRIAKTKYLKIAHRGEDIGDSKIEVYRQKGLRFLYLTKEDFAKYVSFTVDLSKKVNSVSQISPEKKRHFMRYTAELVMEQVFLKDADAPEFEFASEFMQNTLGVIQEQDETFQLLDSLNSHANHLYAHSLAVSIYAVMVARQLNWNWPPTLFKVSTAGLMHDIGCKELPAKIIEMPRVVQSQEDRRLYESHTVRGMELLNEVKRMSEDVILVAYQHHEDCLGASYPQ